MLEGFEEQVMGEWYVWLWEMGFEWDRCYSILRTSGAGTVGQRTGPPVLLPFFDRFSPFFRRFFRSIWLPGAKTEKTR